MLRKAANDMIYAFMPCCICTYLLTSSAIALIWSAVTSRTCLVDLSWRILCTHDAQYY